MYTGKKMPDSNYISFLGKYSTFSHVSYALFIHFG